MTVDLSTQCLKHLCQRHFPRDVLIKGVGKANNTGSQRNGAADEDTIIAIPIHPLAMGASDCRTVIFTRMRSV